jgi:hypothetical protein
MIISLFGLILICSCTSTVNEGSCTTYIHAKVDNISIAPNSQIRQNIPIIISYQCINGCGNFGSIEETNQGKIRSIKLIAKYEGCICTQQFITRQYTYNFVASEVGTYTLVFLQPDGTSITKTITI